MRDARRPFIPQTRAWGLALAFGSACISGIAVYVNTYLVVQSDDATVYTTAKNGVAALILLGLFAVVGTRRSSRGGSPTVPDKRLLVVLGLIGGSIPFVLFFEGLARSASPISAGFIHKTLLVWVALLAVPLLRERLTIFHIGAIVLLLVGQATLADFSVLTFGIGELMIFGATLLWAVEFVIAKQVLSTTPTLVVGTARLGIGALLLVAFVIVTGRGDDLMSLTGEQLGWALVSGAILAAFVGTWYAALARAQAIDVTAVLVFGQVITSLLAARVESLPIADDLLGLTLIAAGVAVAVGGAMRRPREGVPA